MRRKLQRRRSCAPRSPSPPLSCLHFGAIENWGNPNEDGFSYVGVFYATIFFFPVGLFLLVGAIAGRGRYVRRAWVAFFIAAAITLIVVAFLVVQHIADNNHGKVFGIQFGFQLDHQDRRET